MNKNFIASNTELPEIEIKVGKKVPQELPHKLQEMNDQIKKTEEAISPIGVGSNIIVKTPKNIRQPAPVIEESEEEEDLSLIESDEEG